MIFEDVLSETLVFEIAIDKSQGAGHILVEHALLACPLEESAPWGISNMRSLASAHVKIRARRAYPTWVWGPGGPRRPKEGPGSPRRPQEAPAFGQRLWKGLEAVWKRCSSDWPVTEKRFGSALAALWKRCGSSFGTISDPNCTIRLGRWLASGARNCAGVRFSLRGVILPPPLQEASGLEGPLKAPGGS